MSNIVNIGVTVATLLLVSLIGAASVFGWGLDNPAQKPEKELEEAYDPERGYMIYYGGVGRGGMGRGGGFRGGK